jgi:hypothetical protein
VYKAVSGVIAPVARSFTDKTFSLPASYVQFQITAVYKNDERFASNEKLLYYLPVVYAPKPANLKGTWIKEKDKTYIDLTWDSKPSSDTLTRGYNLYASNRFDNKLYYEESLPLIVGNSQRYEVYNLKSNVFRFAVAAVSKYNAVGHFSYTIQVPTPSVSLPTPVIYPYSIDTAQRVMLSWNYDAIADLKGFRIYKNGNMVSSEYELKKDTRSFVTPPLKLGDTYLFTLQAVTENGIESERSIARDIYIYRKSKN